MDYEVRVEEAAARPLAAVRGTASRANLGSTILRLLDEVWPVLRSQKVRTDHNVVLYLDGVMTIEAGVEVSGEFQEVGEVRRSTTPAGEVATTTHFGEYSDLAGAYAALDGWCEATGRRKQGPSWEVYGDWEEDPRLRRTDVFYLLRAR
jgi:effector-binding domain-containing protein